MTRYYVRSPETLLYARSEGKGFTDSLALAHPYDEHDEHFRRMITSACKWGVRVRLIQATEPPPAWDHPTVCQVCNGSGNDRDRPIYDCFECDGLGVIL